MLAEAVQDTEKGAGEEVLMLRAGEMDACALHQLGSYPRQVEGLGGIRQVNDGVHLVFGSNTGVRMRRRRTLTL